MNGRTLARHADHIWEYVRRHCMSLSAELHHKWLVARISHIVSESEEPLRKSRAEAKQLKADLTVANASTRRSKAALKGLITACTGTGVPHTQAYAEACKAISFWPDMKSK